MKESEKEREEKEDADLDEEITDPPKPRIPGDKRLFIGLGIIVVLIIAAGLYSYLGRSVGSSVGADVVVNMSATMDIGWVTVRGDGLPGYDIDRDGEADYLSKGFGYYKGLFESGGFDYGPGAILLEEFDVEIILPPIHFDNDTLVESSVGSVVIFSGEDEATGIEGTVIIKTLGPALSTYTLNIKDRDGKSYSITDLIARDGAGQIGKREVEIVGRMVIRE